MIVSVINQKGGVGKTTVAVNLAAALAANKQRVLLVDLDPQANASTLCNVRAVDSIFDVLIDPDATPMQSILVDTPVPGLRLAPGHKALAGLESALRDTLGKELLLKEALLPVEDQFEVIVIDNAPSLGIASAMALIASDMALVPLQCQPLALEGFAQVAQTIDLARKRFRPDLKRRIVLTMLDGRTSHGTAIVEQTRQRFGEEVFRAMIPKSAELERGLINRATGGSVLSYAPDSKAAASFRGLAEEILEVKYGA